MKHEESSRWDEEREEVGKGEEDLTPDFKDNADFYSAGSNNSDIPLPPKWTREREEDSY